MTLLALALAWPAWILSGLAAEALDPGGIGWLLRAGLLLLSLDLLGRLLDRFGGRLHG